MAKKLTTEEFIERAREVHGQRYDYSLVDYVNSTIKVKIVCEEHGVFEQIPKSHMKGVGCSVCGTNKSARNRSSDNASFIEKAVDIHGNRYIYDQTLYTASLSKIEIMCPIHGKFLQTPNSHLNGQGCPQCGVILNSSNRSNTTQEFISKAKRVHGNLYDYSQVTYTGSKIKVDILCKIHGKFHQIPNCHLTGQGCSVCADEKAPGGINCMTLSRSVELRNKPAKLYRVQLFDSNTDEKFFKIGLTVQEGNGRFTAMKPYQVITKEIIYQGRLEDVYDLEQLILSEMKESKRTYRPKHKFGGHTECYR